MKAVSFIFVLVSPVILAADLHAQGSRGNNPMGRSAEFENQRRKADREAMVREMRGKKPSKEELQNAARIKAETKEDLEGLQQTYNEIAVKLSGGQTPPSEFIAAAAERVNKYATRLKSNIAFPKPESDEAPKPIVTTGDARKDLHDLCTRIYEFLTSPMIENPNVLNVEAATSVRILLDSIILLSGRFGKK